MSQLPPNPHATFLSESEWQQLTDSQQLETDSDRVQYDMALQEQLFAWSPANRIPTPSPSQEIEQAQVTPSRCQTPSPLSSDDVRNQDEVEEVVEEEDSIEVNDHMDQSNFEMPLDNMTRKAWRSSHRLPASLLNVRSFNWFGTHNSMEYMDKTELDEAMYYNKDVIKYVAIYKEVAPTTGKEHWHSIVILNKLTYAHAVVSIDPNAHWEKVNGRLVKCFEYVSKGGDLWFEYGIQPSQLTNFLETKEKGTRKRTAADVEWENAVILAKRGAEELRDTKLYARFRAYFDDILASVHEDKIYQGDLKFKNLWIYGPPGTGKSRMVWDYAREYNLSIYVKLQNKWFDGFRGHDIILIDDAGENMKALASHLKNWADRYPFTAEVKGGTRRVNPTFNLVVTSNYAIEDLFNTVDAEAIKRRFDVLFME